jgi:hypothetical protein
MHSAFQDRRSLREMEGLRCVSLEDTCVTIFQMRLYPSSSDALIYMLPYLPYCKSGPQADHLPRLNVNLGYVSCSLQGQAK